MAITLTGSLVDITGNPIDETTKVYIKSPTYSPSGTGIETSQPTLVDTSTGDITIEVTSGLGWLYVEGRGWSDTIPFVAAEGMANLVEAVLNAMPENSEVKNYLLLMDELKADLRHFAATVLSAGANPLPGGTDWNTLLVHGTYKRLYTTSSDLNSPTASLGVLHVDSAGHPSDSCTQTFYAGSGFGIWHRSRNGSGAWSDWVRLDADTVLQERSRTISTGTDWDTLLDHGEFRRTINRASPTADPNSPPTVSLGVLHVDSAGHPSNACTQTFYAPSGFGIWHRARNASGAWSDWVRLDSPAGGVSSGTPETVMGMGAARREFLISELRDVKGGTIGTDGKAAVCFRFDHHTDQFNRLIVPELERLKLPWAQALNSRTQGVGNNTMTWSEIQSLALRTGGEVFNHGATHADAQNIDTLVREVVTGREELRGHLPQLPIVGWMQPGTGGSYGGLQPFRTEDNWTTEAGRMIMAHHAIVYGYKPGIMENLDGQPSIGQCHLSMDNMSYEAIVTEIDRAITTKSGIVLMCHPNYVEEVITDGQLTLETLTSVMEYVADKRDNGVVEVVSASGLQFCDVTHSHRRNLMDVSFTGNKLTGQRLANRATFAANGAHEVYAELSATGTVTVDVFTPDKVLDVSYSVDVSGTDVKVWLPFTIPVGATDVSLRVNGATSGRAIVRPI